MKVLKTFKAALLMYWDGAKNYPVDALVCLMAIGVLIYWYFNPDTNMAGGVAILAVYASGNVIRHNRTKGIIKKLME